MISMMLNLVIFGYYRTIQFNSFLDFKTFLIPSAAAAADRQKPVKSGKISLIRRRCTRLW